MKDAANDISVETLSRVDTLGRTAFTRHLLQLVHAVDASEGVVVGLEGEWGSGKTWVLRQFETINEEPNGKDPLAVVHFNPRMLSGSHALVEALLLQLATDLRLALKDRLPKAAEIASNLLDYAAALSLMKHAAPALELALPGAGALASTGAAAADSFVSDVRSRVSPVLSRWKNHPERVSLQTVRKKLRSALQNMQRRVLVIVDDLDRLPPSSWQR
jgi:predicted KAP-like P-loop ATPase